MSNILIIEPDKRLAITLQRSFEQEGYNVRAVHTGQAAVSTADDWKPDVVVCELAMPQHNGVAFLQEFRSYDDWFFVPVVVYSQIPREDTSLSARQWHKLGVSAYCYKPTTRLKDLHYAIKQALNFYEAA